MPLVEQLVPHDLLAFCTTHEPDPKRSREEHAEITGARFEQALAATASAADGSGDEGVLLVLKLHDPLLNGALGHEPVLFDSCASTKPGMSTIGTPT